MRLDPSQLPNMTPDAFRVLRAIEVGMRNHQWVPLALLLRLANVRPGAATPALGLVHKHKLVVHATKAYSGYRLTFLGYDFLSLRALRARGGVDALGSQIGVGKEADVFLVQRPGPPPVPAALKLHRLGRTSFTRVRQKRDYHRHRQHTSFLYLSRLAALREFAYLKVLYTHGFAVPRPHDWSRHCVIMEWMADTVPLARCGSLADPQRACATLLEFAARLARHGLVHCDLNEFNVLVHPATEQLTVIDLPQMVSTDHPNAPQLFARDVAGVCRWFRIKLNYVPDTTPAFAAVAPHLAPHTRGTPPTPRLDVMLRAPGHLDGSHTPTVTALGVADGEAGDDDRGIGDGEVGDDDRGSGADQAGDDGRGGGDGAAGITERTLAGTATSILPWLERFAFGPDAGVADPGAAAGPDTPAPDISELLDADTASELWRTLDADGRSSLHSHRAHAAATAAGVGTVPGAAWAEESARARALHARALDHTHAHSLQTEGMSRREIRHRARTQAHAMLPPTPAQLSGACTAARRPRQRTARPTRARARPRAKGGSKQAQRLRQELAHVARTMGS